MRDRLDTRLDLGVRLGLDRLIFEDRLDGSDANGVKPFTSIICRRQPLSTFRKCRLLKKANFAFTEHRLCRQVHCLATSQNLLRVLIFLLHRSTEGS